MALVLKDRISETTTTSGTGTITLAGATSGFVAFSTIGDGNTTYYCITDGSAWEVGLGTYTSSGNTLARTTVYSNSNGNTSPITLSGSIKNVFGVLPADGIITVSGTSIQVPGTAVLSVANGGTGSNTATFSGANITSLNASSISSGTLDNARTTASASNGASTIVARDASGNFAGNVVTISAGSNGAPSLTFSGDTDTGIYSATGNSLNFAEGAAGYKVGFRNAPPVGTQTGSYSLGTADIGKYVQIGSGGSVTIPDATFSEGDVVALFNNTSGNVTITCSITTAYIAGTDSDKATMTLATRGVATVLFISGTVCVVSGNVS